MTCAVCGGPADRVVEVEHRGSVEAERPMCAGCLSETRRELADLRRTFEALLAEGMSRERANEVMIRWHIRSGQTSPSPKSP